MEARKLTQTEISNILMGMEFSDNKFKPSRLEVDTSVRNDIIEDLKSIKLVVTEENLSALREFIQRSYERSKFLPREGRGSSAATSIAAESSQMSLNTKHTTGQAGSDKGKTISDIVDAVINPSDLGVMVVPKTPLSYQKTWELATSLKEMKIIDFISSFDTRTMAPKWWNVYGGDNSKGPKLIISINRESLVVCGITMNKLSSSISNLLSSKLKEGYDVVVTHSDLKTGKIVIAPDTGFNEKYSDYMILQTSLNLIKSSKVTISGYSGVDVVNVLSFNINDKIITDFDDEKKVLTMSITPEGYYDIGVGYQEIMMLCLQINPESSCLCRDLYDETTWKDGIYVPCYKVVSSSNRYYFQNPNMSQHGKITDNVYLIPNSSTKQFKIKGVTEASLVEFFKSESIGVTSYTPLKVNRIRTYGHGWERVISDKRVDPQRSYPEGMVYTDNTVGNPMAIIYGLTNLIAATNCDAGNCYTIMGWIGHEPIVKSMNIGRTPGKQPFTRASLSCVSSHLAAESVKSVGESTESPVLSFMLGKLSNMGDNYKTNKHLRAKLTNLNRPLLPNEDENVSNKDNIMNILDSLAGVEEEVKFESFEEEFMSIKNLKSSIQPISISVDLVPIVPSVVIPV